MWLQEPEWACNNERIYQILNISQTSLVASHFPSELSLLSSLRTLLVTRSYLRTTLLNQIPYELFGLTRLETLGLVGTCLSGTIPSSIASFDNLSIFSVAYNALNGHIPETLGDMEKLYLLNLQNNQLSGSLSWRISGLKILPILLWKTTIYQE